MHVNARSTCGPGYLLRLEATVCTHTVHSNVSPWVPRPQVLGSPVPGSRVLRSTEYSVSRLLAYTVHGEFPLKNRSEGTQPHRHTKCHTRAASTLVPKIVVSDVPPFRSGPNEGKSCMK